MNKDQIHYIIIRTIANNRCSYKQTRSITNSFLWMIKIE